MTSSRDALISNLSSVKEVPTLGTNKDACCLTIFLLFQSLTFFSLGCNLVRN